MAIGKKTGGRHAGTPNKATADVRAAAQKYTTAAIARLAHLMEHAESEAAQVAAAKELLDRAHGRPAQFVQADINAEFNLLRDVMQALDGTSRGLPADHLAGFNRESAVPSEIELNRRGAT